ncbi:hypothetical protein ACFY2R_03685 [Micromonospora olivasterospora]|uniref:Uncharacterized protein n=1 Tax=Micromonospora olivasterospora TaxID=1880 RepID=A0A562IAT2_MICOL|nr:hypothetical protein [Micromonospora olivasterospora]TWH68002.1 hypothetical protein JD77_02989 [Micromonospora olivasterospora]
MSVDHDLTTEDDPGHPAEVTAAALLGYAAAAVLLVAWFLYGWLVQRQGFVASVGESAGAASALLLAIAVIGTFRRDRR